MLGENITQRESIQELAIYYESETKSIQRNFICFSFPAMLRDKLHL